MWANPVSVIALTLDSPYEVAQVQLQLADAQLKTRNVEKHLARQDIELREVTLSSEAYP